MSVNFQEQPRLDPRIIRVWPGLSIRLESKSTTALVESIKRGILANGLSDNFEIAVFAMVEEGVRVYYVYDGHIRLKAVQQAIAEGASVETIGVTYVAAPV